MSIDKRYGSYKAMKEMGMLEEDDMEEDDMDKKTKKVLIFSNTKQQAEFKKSLLSKK